MSLSVLEKVLLLKSVPLFRPIAGEELAYVAQIAEEVRFAAGERFIRQGERGDCLYVVVDGEVEITAEGVGSLGRHGPRSIMGEMAVLARIPRTASCDAVTDVVALRIDFDDFWELMGEQVEVALGIIRELIARLEHTQALLGPTHG